MTTENQSSEQENRQFSNEEIAAGKGLALLAYLGPLLLLPWIMERNNRYVMAHVNQGLALLIIWVLMHLAISIFFVIPVLNLIAYLVNACIAIAGFGFAIWGITQTVNGTFSPMPYISILAKKLNVK